MTSELSFAFMGDFMPGRLLNFDPVLLARTLSLNSRLEHDENFVKEFLKSASVRVCNLEGCFSDTLHTLPVLIDNPGRFLAKHFIAADRISALGSFQIDCVVIANNHILDSGKDGVKLTVNLLNKASIKWVGFGSNRLTAWKPRIFTVTGSSIMQSANLEREFPGSNNTAKPNESELKVKTRVALFSMADHLVEWKASDNKCGVNYFDIENFSMEERNPNRDQWCYFEHVHSQIYQVKDKVDIIIFSIHWGSNFCWEPCQAFKDFAHQLIDHGVHIVFGHSSHHIQGIEQYNNGLIIYGAGDFLNDYDLYELLLNRKGFVLPFEESSCGKARHGQERGHTVRDATVVLTRGLEILWKLFLEQLTLAEGSLGNEYKTYRSDLSFVYKVFVQRSCCATKEGKVSEERVKLARLQLLPVKIRHGHLERPSEEEVFTLMSKVQELSSRLGALTFHKEDEYLVANLS